ncbi:hypothetical protein BSKO_00901 [Bryopsis sp. KO-2023]|nr:hypothetical protein BSKO_00901 [Bryopsis sp. KO-2023]
MPFPGLIQCFCVLIVCSGCVGGVGVVEDLIVKQGLTAQKLMMGKEDKVYRLIGLKRNKSYEVRVSYPATIPCKISLGVFRSKEGISSSSKFRKLLNVEKLIFNSEESDVMFAKMHAEADGVRPLAVNEPQDWLLYNIVLEEVMFGIPVDSFPVIAMAVAILVVAFLFVCVCDLPGLDWLVAWIRGPVPEKDR